MTPDAFRRLVLAFADTVERSHMNHPDFRVGGKVFATLGYPDKTHAMVKLSPAQQEDFVASHPNVFAPVNGAWGRQGSTTVDLKAATRSIIQPALLAAWRNYAPKPLLDASLGDFRRRTAKSRKKSRSS
jgi:hypothetical protein